VIAVHGGVEPDAARTKIEAWCEEHRLPVPGLRLGRVSTTAAIVGDAEDERACMVVCGATRLTLAERPVHETVGTRLAALTSCPVLVIPPRHPVPRRATFDRIEPDVAAEHGPMI
jgi:nucleotide-binding universal stress UspA family protein